MYIYIYIYIFLFLFLWVCMCMLFCDFVCIALLLPIVLQFCLSIFLSVCFLITFKFFLFLILIFLFFILITLFYLFTFFFLSFILSFRLSCEAARVLVLGPGVRPVTLRWESWDQDIGPPETSWLHVISNGKSSPRHLHLNVKTQLHITTCKLDTLCQTTSKTATQAHPLAERLPKNHNKVTDTPKHTIGCSPAHQKDKIQPHPPEHRHQSPPPGNLHNPLNQP